MQNFAPPRLSKRSMQISVHRIIAGLSIALLTACAAQPDSREEDRVADFIAVSELEESSKVRMRHQFSYKEITNRYVVLQAHNDYYLVEFRRRCHELGHDTITPDIRHERNVLRPGVDTIRGCRIDRIFVIDETQAQELEQLGKAAGD